MVSVHNINKIMASDKNTCKVRSWYQQASQKFKENDKTFEFKKQVSIETFVIFS